MNGTEADRIALWFIAREDVMAIQGAGGMYRPARNRHGGHIRFTGEAIRRHIAGEHTLGHYVVKKDHCKLFAFDIDLDKGWYGRANCRAPWPPDEVHDLRALMSEDESHPLRREVVKWLRCYADGLESMIRRRIGIKTAVSFSGSKGMHVYGLYGERVEAQRARDDAVRCLVDLRAFQPSRGEQNWKGLLPGLTIEVFPKQSFVKEGGFGNLLRLPLGVHQKSGAQSYFIDTSAPPTELVEIQLESLLSR